MAGDLEATALQLEKWLSPAGPTPERLWRRSTSFLETVVLGIRHQNITLHPNQMPCPGDCLRVLMAIKYKFLTPGDGPQPGEGLSLLPPP